MRAAPVVSLEEQRDEAQQIIDEAMTIWRDALRQATTTLQNSIAAMDPALKRPCRSGLLRRAAFHDLLGQLTPRSNSVMRARNTKVPINGETVMSKNQRKAIVSSRAPPLQDACPNRQGGGLTPAEAELYLLLSQQLRERHPELTGSPTEVVDTYMEFVEKEVEDFCKEQIQARMAAARAKYIAEALAGPSAYNLKRFLATVVLPTFERVDAFFTKSCLPRVAPGRQERSGVTPCSRRREGDASLSSFLLSWVTDHGPKLLAEDGHEKLL